MAYHHISITDDIQEKLNEAVMVMNKSLQVYHLVRLSQYHD